MDISLFYFGAQHEVKDEEARDCTQDPYALLIEGAKLADELGFTAVWTPERHFHGFGGIYADPAITSAAVAAVTNRVAVRAGSVVLPLHDPVRLTEQWAMVDNLSSGRVGVSIASGWHPRDFVLSGAHASFDTRKADMERMLSQVRSLWSGEPMTRESGFGTPVEFRIAPRPLQRELPVWVTSSGNRETFELAGRLGANVLTHLLGQSVEDVAANVAAYRVALAEHHPWKQGIATLMVHAYLADSIAEARADVRAPLRSYFESSMALEKTSTPQGSGASISKDERDLLLDRAVDRFTNEEALFGTVETVRTSLARFADAGVDEVACLVDFGVEHARTLDSIRRLGELVTAHD